MRLRSVCYYVERYLPASQAFVAQQALALQQYRPTFLTGSLTDSPSARLGRFDVHNLHASPGHRVGELALKMGRVAIPALFPPLRDINLLHAHFGKNGYVLGPLAKALRKPLVTTFHGFDATYRGDPKTPGGFNQVRFFRNGRQQMAEQRQWSIAVSKFIEDRLLDLGFSPDRIRRHYVGIDTSLFQMTPQERKPHRVVSVARFVEYKGHRFMIDALAQVVAAGIPVEFIMVGQGPLRSELEIYARGRIPQVQIFDSLSQAEIAKLLSSARLYLHGSVTLENGHAEAFGLANLEAQAVGTPVVTFDSGGVAEALIQGQTGFAVPERNTQAMADRIASLLQDEMQWASFSQAAARSVRDKFDIRVQTPALEAIYDEVLAAHQGARA